MFHKRSFFALGVLLLTARAEARMASSWGGSIVVVDMETGSVLKELDEPCMFNGITGGESFVNIQSDDRKRFVKLEWSDVVFSTAGYKDTPRDGFFGEPGNKSPRLTVFSVPGFSTTAVVPDVKWSDLQLESLPSAGVDGFGLGEAERRPPKLPIGWDPFDSVVYWSGKRFFTWPGYGLNAYDFSSSTKEWSVDFNPTNDPLPGGTPRAKVFEVGDRILVATDRLGIRFLEKKTGALVWYLPYANPDVIPAIGQAQKYLIIAPAMRSDDWSKCEAKWKAKGGDDRKPPDR